MSKSMKIIFLIIAAVLFGLYSLVFFVFKEGSTIGGVLMLIGAIVLGFPGGLLVAFVVCPTIGDMFGNGIFYPTSRLKAPPKLIAPIRGLINNRKIKEAVAELTDILQSHPYDTEALLMLVEILMDEMQEYEASETMMKNFLSYKKLKPADSVIDILMRYADCCETLDASSRAIPLFEQELTKKYSESSLKAIRRRLDVMKAAGR